MPYTCFSYSADLPPGTRARGAARPGLGDPLRMPNPCFSYPADVPRSMPYACFSYPIGATPCAGNRAAPPALPGLRRMPSMCFRY
jgi:hypothetical protein